MRSPTARDKGRGLGGADLGLTTENLQALPRREPVLPGSAPTYTDDGASSVVPQTEHPHAGSSNSGSSDSNVTTLQDAEGKQHRQRTIRVQHPESGGGARRGQIQYKGVTLREAAERGNLPMCVLIWGMASAEKVSLMVPDELGNNPLHYAVRAETPEVMGFIYQQARGQLNSETRLVDSTNLDGETPLLRACYAGKIPIIKALLDEGSDPFRTDKFGCTVFIILAKSSHLWCLNFIFFSMVAKCGVRPALECLAKVDCDGHSCLDWAATSGDVNVIEFLIRKGMNPQRVNQTGRGPLYWAVSSGQAGAVAFLAKAGCNPYLPDHRNTTPRSMAKARGDAELLDAIKCFTGESHRLASGSLRGQPVDLIVVESGSNVVLNPPTLWDGSVNPSQLDFLYSADGSSHAVRALHSSRLSHTLLHASLVFFVWLLAVFMPFWSWVGLASVTVWVWRYSREAAAAAADGPPGAAAGGGGGGGGGGSGGAVVSSAGGAASNAAAGSAAGGVAGHSQQLGPGSGSPGPGSSGLMGQAFSACSLRGLVGKSPQLRRMLLSREKFLGLWLGTMAAVGVMLLCCVSVLDDSLGIMGVASASHDSSLFLAVFVLFFCCLLLWWSLCFLQPDPGAVDTRMRDFDEVMAESAKCGGAPPQHLYCPTTLMKKPTRAKYCASTGLLVARMDHHCVWLNNSVGFGNHRRFLLFVAVHLLFSLCAFAFIVRALSAVVSERHLSPWNTARLVTKPQYFFVVAVAAAQALLIAFLFGLLCEQVANICSNITVNERLNRSRYYWMHDAKGKDFNRFDRSCLSNVLEFFGLCGHEVDYRALYLFPEQAATHAALPSAHQHQHQQQHQQQQQPHQQQQQQQPGPSPSLGSDAAAKARLSKQSFIQQQVMQQQQQQQRQQARLSLSKGRGAGPAHHQSVSTASTAPSSASSAASSASSATSSADNFAMHEVYGDDEAQANSAAAAASASAPASDRGSYPRPSVLQQNRLRRDSASSPKTTLDEASSPLHPRSASEDLESGGTPPSRPGSPLLSTPPSSSSSPTPSRPRASLHRLNSVNSSSVDSIDSSL